MKIRLIQPSRLPAAWAIACTAAFWAPLAQAEVLLGAYGTSGVRQGYALDPTLANIAAAFVTGSAVRTLDTITFKAFDTTPGANSDSITVALLLRGNTAAGAVFSTTFQQLLQGDALAQADTVTVDTGGFELAASTGYLLAFYGASSIKVVGGNQVRGSVAVSGNPALVLATGWSGASASYQDSLGVWKDRGQIGPYYSVYPGVELSGPALSAPVPEPAAAPMWLAGAGLLGLLMRQRRA